MDRQTGNMKKDQEEGSEKYSNAVGLLCMTCFLDKVGRHCEIYGQPCKG